MAGNNTICVIGRVGTDPESRFIDSGRQVVKFRLAVNRPGKGSDGQSVTDWFSVELWGKSAEIAADLVRKGGLVAVSGACQIDQWESQGGGKGTTVKIAGESFYLCGDRGAGDSQGQGDGGEQREMKRSRPITPDEREADTRRRVRTVGQPERGSPSNQGEFIGEFIEDDDIPPF